MIIIPMVGISLFFQSERWGTDVQGTHCREGETGHNVNLKGTMGDMQRSRTISTQNQVEAKTTEQRINRLSKERPIIEAESSLQRIVQLAREKPDMVFTSLVHRIDMTLLRKAYQQIHKTESSGVDEVTAKEYVVDLEENLYKLYERLRRGQYVAQPVKRVWIDKEGGKQRPIGIPVLEDKIVQKAVMLLLEPIYEVNFYDFSYGFRPNRNAHMALQGIWRNIQNLGINWIVDADVSGYFDNIDHGNLREFIKRRVNDGGIIRLIGKWLNAGVMEAEELTNQELGTPQGGVISPLLANIYLHYVLDDWFVKDVEPRMEGRCFLIRYADDFVAGFEYENDAKRYMAVLFKRFEKYKLTIHPEKSKLVDFRKPYGPNGKGGGGNTFDFLGFTHYWGKSRKGRYVVKRKTMRKRLRRFIKHIWSWCRDNRHIPISEQHKKLTEKLRGYYQYYGINGNIKTLRNVKYLTERAWRFWLSRRSHKGRMNWNKFKDSILSKRPLPTARIAHSNV